MQTILDDYVRALKLGNRKEATIKVYREDISRFISFFSLNSIEDLRNLKASDYHRFYESLLKTEERPENPLSPTSLNRVIRSISAFLSYLNEEDNSFFSVKIGGSRFVKEVKVKRVVLTDDECEAMLRVARNEQERFMLKLMMKSAIRRDAISNIKLSDISGCKITIWNKGGNQEYVYLNDELCNMLNAYLAVRNTESEYLFYGTRGVDGENGQLSGVSVCNRVKWCAMHSGMSPERAEKVTPHTLRRTTITNIAMKHGILAAQMVARHSSQLTTKGYVHDGDEIARKLMMED